MVDAITTATQNLVVAYNQNTKAATNVAGEVTSITYSGPTQVVINAGPCRLVHFCIVTNGIGTVEFYNSQTLTALPVTSLLYVASSSVALGITNIGMQFSNGLTIVVGAGVSVNCTYSITRS